MKRNGPRLGFSAKIAARQTFAFALAGATITSSHVDDPLLEAQRLCGAAAIAGKRGMIARHAQAWDELWKGRVEIEGDETTQRDINNMLYHLYAFVREGSGYSIPPMGLSRGFDGYMGHIFWDSETWMLPVFLALNPPLARTMLDYRFVRLDEAKRDAEAQGWRGARYPWESAATGDEDVWATSVHGATEIHVTAAVGLAAWNYFRVTQDMDWLRAKGFPMIRETADFWVSRVTRNGPGRYDIDHVTGANEGANDVSNSAFTNAGARKNLEAATQAAKRLGLEPDPEWEEVRANIPILKLANGVTREHAAYRGGNPVDIHYVSYPMEAITDRDQIRRDLDYSIAVRGKNWPEGMGTSVYAVLAQRLGQPEEAYRHFKASYIRNQRPPFGVMTERSTQRNPYFATGAGGVLQAVIFGFGGLKITDNGFVHEPTRLPSRWKSVRLIGVGRNNAEYVAR